MTAGKRPVLGVMACSAGGVERIRTGLVQPALDAGWQVAITLTPTAAHWLQELDELAVLENLTDLPVRSTPRRSGDERTHPPVDCYVVAPASANTVAKLALGIADNQLLTTVCEAIGTGTVPVVVFPRINAAHARQPAWPQHLEALRSAGVHLIYGDDVWALYEPRQAPPGRELPWTAILDAASRLTLQR